MTVVLHSVTVGGPNHTKCQFLHNVALRMLNKLMHSNCHPIIYIILKCSMRILTYGTLSIYDASY